MAGRTSQPWAYMVLIDDIFSNIRSFNEDLSDIRLPTRATFTAMSLALDRQMGPRVPEVPAMTPQFEARANPTPSPPSVRKISIEISRPTPVTPPALSPLFPDKTSFDSTSTNRPQARHQKLRPGWKLLLPLCCVSSDSYDRDASDYANVRVNKPTKATKVSNSASHHPKFMPMLG